jgi:hypothetical protein
MDPSRVASARVAQRFIRSRKVAQACLGEREQSEGLDAPWE